MQAGIEYCSKLELNKLILIVMKHFFLLLLFVCTNGMLIAQEALSSMPKEKRDSLLVEILRNY